MGTPISSSPDVTAVFSAVPFSFRVSYHCRPSMSLMPGLPILCAGHVFCHTCLMEALIAGEQRAGPGEPKRSQCPVCRKALSRTKTGDIIPLLLMKKALATQPRRPKAASAANPAPA